MYWKLLYSGNAVPTTWTTERQLYLKNLVASKHRAKPLRLNASGDAHPQNRGESDSEEDPASEEICACLLATAVAMGIGLAIFLGMVCIVTSNRRHDQPSSHGEVSRNPESWTRLVDTPAKLDNYDPLGIDSEQQVIRYIRVLSAPKIHPSDIPGLATMLYSSNHQERPAACSGSTI